MSLRVTVTYEDMACGFKRSINFCPVARAIRGAYEGRLAAADVEVTAGVAFISGACYKLPSIVATWIERFDNSRLCLPFSFVIR